MARPQRESFAIQVRSSSSGGSEGFQADQTRASPHRNLNFSAMKLFDRFRKIVMRLIIFSLPSTSRRSRATSESVPGRRPCDHRPDPPKASFSGGSSYYSSISHYNEAISDCIEFFKKSSQEEAEEGIFCARKSDLVV